MASLTTLLNNNLYCIDIKIHYFLNNIKDIREAKKINFSFFLLAWRESTFEHWIRMVLENDNTLFTHSNTVVKLWIVSYPTSIFKLLFFSSLLWCRILWYCKSYRSLAGKRVRLLQESYSFWIIRRNGDTDSWEAVLTHKDLWL